MLLTILVRGHAVDPMQRACYQSTAMARDAPMIQEQWRNVWKKFGSGTKATGRHTTRQV